jgi:hypothetical protein
MTIYYLLFFHMIFSVVHASYCLRLRLRGVGWDIRLDQIESLDHPTLDKTVNCHLPLDHCVDYNIE